MDIFRLDLQVHFFWGFFVTMAGGIYWTPLFYAGMVVTVNQRGTGPVEQRCHWSWGDFWWGLAGSFLAWPWSRHSHQAADATKRSGGAEFN